MPSARPGGASPGTVKPLHVTMLFPIKPCKQVHRAGVQRGQRGHQAGVDVPMMASPNFRHGDSRATSIAQDAQGLSEPAGCIQWCCSPQCPLLLWAAAWEPVILGSQLIVGSVLKALSPLQLLTPWGGYCSLQPPPDTGFHQRDHDLQHAAPSPQLPDGTSVILTPQWLSPVLPSAPDQMHSLHRCLRQSKMLVLVFFFSFFFYYKSCVFKKYTIFNFYSITLQDIFCNKQCRTLPKLIQ